MGKRTNEYDIRIYENVSDQGAPTHASADAAARSGAADAVAVVRQANLVFLVECKSLLDKV